MTVIVLVAYFLTTAALTAWALSGVWRQRTKQSPAVEDPAPHDQPDRPLTVEEAQSAMQEHIDCRRETCGRKQAAFEVLVAAGKLRPAPHRETIWT